eukprot:356604-Chlamydomonas_euryale.AAC.1
MSNQKPAAASDPHTFAIHAPSTEGSVYGRSTRATYAHTHTGRSVEVVPSSKPGPADDLMGILKY